MVSKWSYQGWLLSLEMTASKGSPDLRNSERRRYFICVCTYVHTYTRLYFRACLTRKFMGFFQMQRQPSTEQQKSHIWSCVTELCLLLNPHLPAQSFGPEEWSLEAWAVQGVPQAGCWSRKAVPPRGNDSTADCASGPTACQLCCGPQLHPAPLCQGTGTSRDSSRAAAWQDCTELMFLLPCWTWLHLRLDRPAISSC